MKRSLVTCLTIVLVSGYFAIASPRIDIDQQTPERPRRVELGSFLGVELGEVNRETVTRLKLREERGALIEGITTGSSAARAGLQRNDVIIKWDGEPIESAREVSRHIHETPVGRAVRLGVIRDGSEIEVNVTMGERTALAHRFSVVRPSVAPVRVRPEVVRPLRGPNLGVQLQGMTPQLAEYFGLSKRSGALVIFVYADSPAAKAGLKAGDVILSVAGQTVENPADVRRVLSDKSDGPVEFKVIRDKQERTLSIQVEKGSRSWLLGPDQADWVVQLAEAPLAIQLPRFDFAPAQLKIPAFKLKPMKIQMPKWTISPITIPQFRMAPMDLKIPQIQIEPRFLLVPRRIVL